MNNLGAKYFIFDIYFNEQNLFKLPLEVYIQNAFKNKCLFEKLLLLLFFQFFFYPKAAETHLHPTNFTL